MRMAASVCDESKMRNKTRRKRKKKKEEEEEEEEEEKEEESFFKKKIKKKLNFATNLDLNNIVVQHQLLQRRVLGQPCCKGDNARVL